MQTYLLYFHFYSILHLNKWLRLILLPTNGFQSAVWKTGTVRNSGPGARLAGSDSWLWSLIYGMPAGSLGRLLV